MQQEFKASHHAVAFLVVSVHIVPRVFLGKWTEAAASFSVLLLICEATVKYLLLFWMQKAMQGCAVVERVIYHFPWIHCFIFNRHFSCNSQWRVGTERNLFYNG